MTDRKAESAWWLEQAIQAEKDMRPEEAARFLRHAVDCEQWKRWPGYGDVTSVNATLAREKAFQVTRFLIPALKQRIKSQ